LPGYHGYVLSNPRPLPFRACKGQLGIWGRFAIRDGRVVEVAA